MKTKLIPKDDTLLLNEVKDEKINCPICAMPDACMMETQVNREQTDPPSELMIERTLISYLCVSCGYTTNSDLIIGSPQLIQAIKESPKLVTDLAIPDRERKLAWFLAVLNFPEKGVIYPDGSLDDWQWVVAPYEPLNEEELKKYINENETEPKYTHRLAIEKRKMFPKDAFQLALNEIQGILIGDK